MVGSISSGHESSRNMGKIKGKGYYAESFGRSNQIYDNWPEASLHKGRWKKFKTLTQAEDHVLALTGGYRGSIEVSRSIEPVEEHIFSDLVDNQIDQEMELPELSTAEDVSSSSSGLIPILVVDPELGEFIVLSPGPGSPVDPVNIRKEEFEVKGAEEEVLKRAKADVVEQAKEILKQGVKTNDPTITTVNRIFRASRIWGEETALRYLTSEIQHPVISCFREITKSDITNLFTACKIRKNFNNLESSIVCLGLIDFLATCVNNPLYNENGKMFGKNIPGFVEKIIQELKGTLRLWGLNDQKYMQERVDTIFSFLRRLTPNFEPLTFANTYSHLIDSLETDVRLKKTAQNQESSTPSPLLDPIASDKSVTFDVQISKSIFETEETEDEQELVEVIPAIIPKPGFHSQTNTQHSRSNNKNKEVQVTTSTSIENQNAFSRMDSETMENINSTMIFQYVKEPPPLALKRSACDEDIEILHCSSGPTPKKQKTTVTKTNPSIVNRGPLKNAFDILMNRSRQLAQQRRNNMAL